MLRFSSFKEKELQTRCALQALSLYLLALQQLFVMDGWDFFYTLNTNPRETDLTSHFHCINSSGWKKIPHPILLASKLQLADSGHTTVLGKKHNCLPRLSVPPLVLSPSPPSPTAHMSWSSPYHLLTGADLFQVHQAPELCTAELCRQIWAQHPSIKKGKSNQVRRASSMLGALPSKHPESCCVRSGQAPNPNFGTTPPSLIPCSCILQALVLSGLVF